MKEQIAIIDDDTIFQFTTKVKIEKLKLANEVLIFGDGEIAVEHLKTVDPSELPSVLLLDINMPIVDGWDFLELYKNLGEDKTSAMSIYMLSSSINPDDVKRAEINPFVKDYITKPIRDEDLEKILK